MRNQIKLNPYLDVKSFLVPFLGSLAQRFDMGLISGVLTLLFFVTSSFAIADDREALNLPLVEVKVVAPNGMPVTVKMVTAERDETTLLLLAEQQRLRNDPDAKSIFVLSDLENKARIAEELQVTGKSVVVDAGDAPSQNGVITRRDRVEAAVFLSITTGITTFSLVTLSGMSLRDGLVTSAVNSALGLLNIVDPNWWVKLIGFSKNKILTAAGVALEPIRMKDKMIHGIVGLLTLYPYSLITSIGKRIATNHWTQPQRLLSDLPGVVAYDLITGTWTLVFERWRTMKNSPFTESQIARFQNIRYVISALIVPLIYFESSKPAIPHLPEIYFGVMAVSGFGAYVITEAYANKNGEYKMSQIPSYLVRSWMNEASKLLDTDRLPALRPRGHSCTVLNIYSR
ncbi:MAG: hypothetical protein AB7F59_05305 [Bdellovibrionales bacterium]